MLNNFFLFPYTYLHKNLTSPSDAPLGLALVTLTGRNLPCKIFFEYWEKSQWQGQNVQVFLSITETHKPSFAFGVKKDRSSIGCNQKNTMNTFSNDLC